MSGARIQSWECNKSFEDSLPLIMVLPNSSYYFFFSCAQRIFGSHTKNSLINRKKQRLIVVRSNERIRFLEHGESIFES
jgi:hypothetical protein